MKEVDVAIVGCGPVGAFMGNMLGIYGISTLILERKTTAHGEPRAFSCDDEGMRAFQRSGLLDVLIQNMVKAKRVDCIGVNGRKFATLKIGDLDFDMGYSPLHFFHQSRLEETLRSGLNRFDHTNLLLGYQVTELNSFDDHVVINALNVADNKEQIFKSKYVIGCDGSNSMTRKLLNIKMDGIDYKEPWLAVSGFVDDKYVKIPNTTYVCDPERPVFVGRGAEGDFRMEFMLLPNESHEEMVQPDKIRKLISPFVDPDNIKICRSVVYTFSKAMAETWKQDRVFLAGDAAHLMPPMMGQGMVSGIRDAVNLSWKLAYVLKGQASAAILDSYEKERKAHTVKMMEISSQIASLFMIRARFAATLRDWFLIALNKIPRIRKFFENMEYKPLPTYEDGLFIKDKRIPKRPEGTIFPQVKVVTKDGELKMLDDLSKLKFMLITHKCDPAKILNSFTEDIRNNWSVFSLKTKNETEFKSENEILDESGKILKWFEKHKANFVLLRPDKFVFMSGTLQDIVVLSNRYNQYFNSSSPSPIQQLVV